jgi:hypothetical protein
MKHPKPCPMTTAFLECALWAGMDHREDETSHPLDADFSISDISPKYGSAWLLEEVPEDVLAELLSFPEDVDGLPARWSK